MFVSKYCNSDIPDVISFTSPNMVPFRCIFLSFLVLGSQLVGLLAMVIANSFFAVLDLTGRPSWLVKYKIQEEKTVPVC